MQGGSIVTAHTLSAASSSAAIVSSRWSAIAPSARFSGSASRQAWYSVPSCRSACFLLAERFERELHFEALGQRLDGLEREPLAERRLAEQ